MKKVLLFAAVCSLTACHMEQAPQAMGPGQTVQQTAFHPTLYVSPGASGGVSKSTYTITELNR